LNVVNPTTTLKISGSIDSIGQASEFTAAVLPTTCSQVGVQELAAVVFQTCKIVLLTVKLFALDVQVENSVFRNTTCASATLNRAVAVKETTTIGVRFATETVGTRIVISTDAINALSRSAEQTAAAETARTQ
jgi:hypothetical protein